MKGYTAYEVEAVVDADGSVTVRNLPFAIGDRIRVIMLREGASVARRHTDDEIERSRILREEMRGSVLSDDRPFDPAAPIEDWDAEDGKGLTLDA
jgi:hypothetical protein